jgi:hypothetical protein
MWSYEVMKQLVTFENWRIIFLDSSDYFFSVSDFTCPLQQKYNSKGPQAAEVT